MQLKMFFNFLLKRYTNIRDVGSILKEIKHKFKIQLGQKVLKSEHAFFK